MIDVLAIKDKSGRWNLTGYGLLIYLLILERPELPPLEMTRLTALMPFAVVQEIGRIAEDFPDIPHLDLVLAYGEKIGEADNGQA
jgi:hypothetical protein